MSAAKDSVPVTNVEKVSRLGDSPRFLLPHKEKLVTVFVDERCGGHMPVLSGGTPARGLAAAACERGQPGTQHELVGVGHGARDATSPVVRGSYRRR